ncbi:MAG: hypothetical protein AAF789_15390 [Bacteroidota bacterium]
MIRSFQISLITCLFILFSGHAFAQDGARLSFEHYKSVKEDVLLVALYENDSVYNEVVRGSIEKYWKITPFKFVPVQDLDSLALDHTYSMLVRDNSHKIRGRGRLIQRNHLALFPAGRGSDFSNYGGHFAVSQFQLADIEQTADYAYKLPAMIHVMNHYMTFLDTVNYVDEDYFGPLMNEWQNQFRHDLNESTLYITEEDLPKGVSLDKIKKAYPHPVVVAPKEEIGKLITSHAPDAAFLHIDPRQKEFWVISTETGHILYHAKTQEYGSFGTKDWKVMAKSIKIDEKSPEAPVEEAILKVNKLFGKLK